MTDESLRWVETYRKSLADDLAPNWVAPNGSARRSDSRSERASGLACQSVPNLVLVTCWETTSVP